jgi:septal ring factor EnvC (AmiA/AmiB activator)
VADTPQRRTEGWSRQRGILAAVVAILAVTAALFLSRLDMANELTVVRSQLTAANQELAENQRELDELEDLTRNQTEGLGTCREAAELAERVRRSLQTLQRGLDRGDEGLLAKGVAEALRLERDWANANQGCLEATAQE